METKNIIFNLRTTKTCHRMNWQRGLWLQDRLYPVGKMEKLFQIQKH